MTIGATTTDDRVRDNTSTKTNVEIDVKVRERMNRYRNLSLKEINRRLDKIEQEWDIERALEVNASTLALAGVLLGTFSSRKWYFMTFIVGEFPSSTRGSGLVSTLAFTTEAWLQDTAEIDEEIYALKVLRGDIDNISSTSSPEEILSAFRR